MGGTDLRATQHPPNSSVKGGWADPVLIRLGACHLTGRDISPSNFSSLSTSESRLRTEASPAPQVGQAGN